MYSDDEIVIVSDFSQSEEDVDEENNSDNNNEIQEKLVEEVDLLSDICLKCISSNFPRFNVAYNTTEDPELQKNFKFLQRVYSRTLLQTAIEDGYFDRDCVSFLINEHLKELDMSNFDIGDYEKVIERISEIGYGFLKVYLCSTLLSQSEVDRIVGLIPHVTILHIYKLCSEETIKIISKSCPELEELHLELCFSEELKGSGLTLLSLHSLKTLSLTGSAVSEDVLSFLLDSLPNLEILHHHLLPLALYQKHQLDLRTHTLYRIKKYKLTALDFTAVCDRFPPQTELLRICLAACPNLKTLSLEIKEENNLELISQFFALENVNLKCISWDVPNLNLDNFLISSGSKLKQLTATWFRLSINTLIEKCPNLQCASLCKMSFENEPPVSTNNRLNCLRELSLEYLTFYQPSHENTVHSLLNSSPKLEKLTISHSQFENSGINSILSNFCSNSVLESVTFISCDIEGVLLESILLSCATLKLLVIESCENIGSDVIASLDAISHSKQNTVEIVWNENELNSEDDVLDIEAFDFDYDYDYDYESFSDDVDDDDVDDDDIDDDY